MYQNIWKSYLSLAFTLYSVFQIFLQIAESGLNAEKILEVAGKHQKDISDQYDGLEGSISSWLDDTERVIQSQVKI